MIARRHGCARRAAGRLRGEEPEDQPKQRERCEGEAKVGARVGGVAPTVVVGGGVTRGVAVAAATSPHVFVTVTVPGTLTV